MADGVCVPMTSVADEEEHIDSVSPLESTVVVRNAARPSTQVQYVRGPRLTDPVGVGVTVVTMQLAIVVGAVVGAKENVMFEKLASEVDEGTVHMVVGVEVEDVPAGGDVEGARRQPSVSFEP